MSGLTSFDCVFISAPKGPPNLEYWVLEKVELSTNLSEKQKQKQLVIGDFVFNLN